MKNDNNNTILRTDSMNSASPKPFTSGLEMNAALKAANIAPESLGLFQAYNSQLPIAEVEGTRIIKCLYQVNKKTGLKIQENAYVRIPSKHLSIEHIESRIEELAPYFLSYMQDIEDKEIKAFHAKGNLQVYTEGLSIDKIVVALTAAMVSGRLNKEIIEEWFNTSIKSKLEILFVEKLGITESSTLEELEKLELIIKAYKIKLASLASPKLVADEEREAMIKVITSCEAEKSDIGFKLISKLEGMKEDVSILLSL